MSLSYKCLPGENTTIGSCSQHCGCYAFGSCNTLTLAVPINIVFLMNYASGRMALLCMKVLYTVHAIEIQRHYKQVRVQIYK